MRIVKLDLTITLEVDGEDSKEADQLLLREVRDRIEEDVYSDWYEVVDTTLVNNQSTGEIHS